MSLHTYKTYSTHFQYEFYYFVITILIFLQYLSIHIGQLYRKTRHYNLKQKRMISPKMYINIRKFPVINMTYMSKIRYQNGMNPFNDNLGKFSI